VPNVSTDTLSRTGNHSNTEAEAVTDVEQELLDWIPPEMKHVLSFHASQVENETTLRKEFYPATIKLCCDRSLFLLIPRIYETQFSIHLPFSTWLSFICHLFIFYCKLKVKNYYGIALYSPMRALKLFAK